MSNREKATPKPATLLPGHSNEKKKLSSKKAKFGNKPSAENQNEVFKGLQSVKEENTNSVVELKKLI